MTFTEVALRLYPYWIMGFLMLLVTYFSKYRTLLRVEPKKVMSFLHLLGIITMYRVVIFYFFKDNEFLQNMTTGVMTIPWQATLLVFWEDAMHTIPLVIFSMMLGDDKKWKKVIINSLIVFVTIAFGLGHVYQGYFAAILLSLYIPFTFSKGQEVGFGTVMICHTLYDVITILTLRSLLG